MSWYGTSNRSHQWVILTSDWGLHDASNAHRCHHSWLLIPSRSSSSAWGLAKSWLSWSGCFSHHSHGSWLRPTPRSGGFPANSKTLSRAESWRSGSNCGCSCTVSTWCQIPSVSSWCKTIHCRSSFWSIPLRRNAITLTDSLLNIANFMFVPLRRLISVALYTHVSSTCGIVKALPLLLLHLLGVNARILLWSFLVLLLFLNLSHYISLFIREILLSHYIIVGTLNSDTHIWIGYSWFIRSLRR